MPYIFFFYLFCESAYEVKSTHYTFVDDYGYSLSAQFFSQTKLCTEIKSYFGSLDNFTVSIMLSQLSAVEQLGNQERE